MSIKEGSPRKRGLLDNCEDVGEHQWPAKSIAVLDSKQIVDEDRIIFREVSYVADVAFIGCYVKSKTR